MCCLIVVSYNQPLLCPSARWDLDTNNFPTITTVPEYHWQLFIDVDNYLYVVDGQNDRVGVWCSDSMTRTKTIGNSLEKPTAVFLTSNGDIYADSRNGNDYRVMKWSSNTITEVTVMHVAHECSGLFVDIYESIYCSITADHIVRKQSLVDSPNMNNIVAGTSISGSEPNMLASPRGIFVTIKLGLYVADCDNNRVQFFPDNEIMATTVTGNGAAGTIDLSCPVSVVVDANGYLFIADLNQNRIVGSGPKGYRCIAGCGAIAGLSSGPMISPRGLSFDRYGNLYFINGISNRIEKLRLDNNSCGK
jgi:DNA-binding beta-propeller fold protein YncE